MINFFRTSTTVVILTIASLLAFFHWLGTRRFGRTVSVQKTRRINVTCHDK